MTRARRPRLAGLVAAALAAAAGLVGLSSAPASAAFCSAAGVNVVVDFNGLGGGVQKGCDPGGANRSADQVFEAAGFSLTPVRQQPGFVCRVENKPASSAESCVNTPPANAYWGLFWSDGKSGRWSYATTGVNGLDVPNGGFVAFSWQGSDSKDAPSAAPVNARPTPAPKPTPPAKPTKQPTKKAPVATTPVPTRAPATGQAPAVVPSAAASASAKAQASASAAPSASASVSPSASTDTTLEPSEKATAVLEATESADADAGPLDEPDGVPAWIPIAVIAVLAAAAGGTVWWRRRPGPL